MAKDSTLGEQGYATLTFCIALAAAGLGLVERFGALHILYSRQIQNDLKVESENLGTLLRMTYGRREFCTEELKSGIFGSSLSTLKSQHPFTGEEAKMPSALEHAPQRLKILKSEFTEPIKLFSDSKSYSIELRLSVTLESKESKKSPLERTISVPFYFVTDGDGGSLTECAATSYSNRDLRTTMEEKACSLLIGDGYHYQPSLHKCSNVGLIAAGITNNDGAE